MEMRPAFVVLLFWFMVVSPVQSAEIFGAEIFRCVKAHGTECTVNQMVRQIQVTPQSAKTKIIVRSLLDAIEPKNEAATGALSCVLQGHAGCRESQDDRLDHLFSDPVLAIHNQSLASCATDDWECAETVACVLRGGENCAPIQPNGTTNKREPDPNPLGSKFLASCAPDDEQCSKAVACILQGGANCPPISEVRFEIPKELATSSLTGGALAACTVGDEECTKSVACILSGRDDCPPVEPIGFEIPKLQRSRSQGSGLLTSCAANDETCSKTIACIMLGGQNCLPNKGHTFEDVQNTRADPQLSELSASCLEGDEECSSFVSCVLEKGGACTVKEILEGISAKKHGSGIVTKLMAGAHSFSPGDEKEAALAACLVLGADNCSLDGEDLFPEQFRLRGPQDWADAIKHSETHLLDRIGSNYIACGLANEADCDKMLLGTGGQKLFDSVPSEMDDHIRAVGDNLREYPETYDALISCMNTPRLTTTSQLLEAFEGFFPDPAPEIRLQAVVFQEGQQQPSSYENYAQATREVVQAENAVFQAKREHEIFTVKEALRFAGHVVKFSAGRFKDVAMGRLPMGHGQYVEFKRDVERYEDRNDELKGNIAEAEIYAYEARWRQDNALQRHLDEGGVDALPDDIDDMRFEEQIGPAEFLTPAEERPDLADKVGKTG